LIWNLPSQETCPKSTEECRKWCYAKKAERIYPQVLPFRRDNLWHSKTRSFVLNMFNIISNHIKRDRTKPEQVRIHESGDFYNQDYLNDWIELSKQFPKQIFYAYTKSYHLDFSKRPKNFIVLLSDDNKKLSKYNNKFDGIASVSNKIDLKSSSWNCLGDCKICTYCYSKPNVFKNLFFNKH